MSRKAKANGNGSAAVAVAEQPKQAIEVIGPDVRTETHKTRTHGPVTVTYTVAHDQPPADKQVPSRIVLEFGFSREEIELIKRTIAKGATDDELKMFLSVCQRKRLDPFTHQIFLIRRWSKKDNCYVATIQIGIDGFRAMAERSGKYAGQDEPEYEYDDKKNLVTARVRIYRKDFQRPIIGVAFWAEIAPADTGDKGFMWGKMPRLMLAKCAEALGLRKAFPEDLSGMYIPEEMHQALDEGPAVISSAPVPQVATTQGSTAPAAPQAAPLPAQPQAAKQEQAPSEEVARTAAPAPVPAEPQGPPKADIPAWPVAKSSPQQDATPAPVAASAPEGFIPLDEAATLPLKPRIAHMRKYLFGSEKSDDRLVHYLFFSVAPFIEHPVEIEQNGRWHPDKWNAAMLALEDRGKRMTMLEGFLAIEGREAFIKWGTAMVEAARAKRVFGGK